MQGTDGINSSFEDLQFDIKCTGSWAKKELSRSKRLILANGEQQLGKWR